MTSWPARVALVSLAALGCDRAQQLTASADPSAPLANLTQWNWNRQIAVDEGGGVHVVWAQLGTTSVDQPADRPDPVDTTSLPPGQIFYARSSDGGETWSAETALTAREIGIDSASVAIGGSSVHVVFRQLDGDRLRVFSRRSSDGGTSWGTPVAVSDNPASISVSGPAFAADGASLYAVWADGRPESTGSVKEIYFSSSADAGATWAPAQPISTPDGFSSWTPSLAVSGGTVHVAWTDERDDVGECTLGANPCREEEYYRRSLDGGASWDPETRLTDDPAESWAPSIAAWGDSVQLAYLDRRTGFFQIYYRRSTDRGASFDDEVHVTFDSSFSNGARPTIAVRDQVVHLTWFGFTDFEADVFYLRSDDGGSTFGSFTNLTATAPGAARMPHVAVGPDHAAHLVWYDTRLSDAAGPRIELFYARP